MGVLMNRDDIIRMGQEAGLIFNEEAGSTRAWELLIGRIERFAHRVEQTARVEEREACAKVLDDMAIEMEKDFAPSAAVDWLRSRAKDIRARGQQ